MKHRLFLKPEQLHARTASDDLTLDPEQAHYLVRVLRLRSGQTLRGFDGLGSEWALTVVEVGPRRGSVTLGARLRQEPPPKRLALASAWLKGSAMDMVVQKATELGASDVYPLHTERSNVRVDEQRQSNKLAHWQRIAISASEQSTRLHVPVVHAPRTLSALLADPPTPRCLFLDLAAAPLDAGPQPEPLTLLVGPEGGWSDAERAAAREAGATFAGLGDLVLRAETAPLAVLAAIRHGWHWAR